MNLDLYLFNLINGYAKKSRTLDLLAIFCADYLGYLLIPILLIFALVFQNWQIFYIPVLVGLFSRFVINEIVYIFYKRKRPLEVLHIVSLIKKPSHPAFPSGHASFFFGMSITVLLFNVPLAAIFVAVTFLVVVARILCGVHWPSDILGGFVVAVIAFLLFSTIV